MERFIENYSDETFDLIVVGGGITGAAVAYDAASRGLSVALVEKKDFGCATSAATSKLIHGGARYLANLEFDLVRESLRERKNLENIAPNFVYPLPVMLTSYGTKLFNTMPVLGAGMVLYDMLSFDKGWTWDKSKKIPLHRAISARKALELEPNVKKDGLKGAFIYYDCASLYPERLTLAFIKSAVKYGAKVANYSKVEGFVFAEDKVIGGVKVKDLINDKDVELKGKLVINCGGPWADLILALTKGESGDKKLRRSEGIHVITKKMVNTHLVAAGTPEGDHVFILPWKGHTLIGTTDKEYTGHPDEFKVTKQAILEMLDKVNSCFGNDQPISYDDVVFTYGGLRPLVEQDTKDVYESSRKYEIFDNAQDGLDGLITVEGGKYTTSRNLAETAMKMIAKKLNRAPGNCITDKQQLAGCEIKDMELFIETLKRDNKTLDELSIEVLGRYYGSDYDKVIKIAGQDKSLAEPITDAGEIPAQALYAVRSEMAMTLEDVLLRRTGIGGLGDPGKDTIKRIADLVANELGWDEARKTKEIEQVSELFRLPQ